MTASLRFSNRYLWIGLIFLTLVALVSFLSAPVSNRLTSGSTWNVNPDGYGAWYAYMAEQGKPVQRWQRPITDLLDELKQDDAQSSAPATLLQINPNFADPGTLYGLRPWLYDWLEAGNRVVILGQQEPATAAPFATQLASPAGDVTIETRRRAQLSDQEKPLLEDGYGAIAWRYGEEKGQITLVVTPHLAANAYRTAPGNFAFLSQLVTEAKGPIWVDEYLHGYKDKDVVVKEVGGNWLSYLAKTPLAIAVTQLLLLALVGILAQNWRLGVRQPLQSPVVDNSEAYIGALAGVLHKAGSHDFVATTLGKAERINLQKALGLGEGPVSDTALEAAWQQATGEGSHSLSPILAPPKLRRDPDLKAWLQRLSALHQSILKRNPAR